MGALLTEFTSLDFVALALLLIGWAGTSFVVEHPGPLRPSVSQLMERYRSEWMVEMLTRQPRIFDAAILATLRQGTTFLASGSMIALGGVLALAGNAPQIDAFTQPVLGEAHSQAFWQAKLAIVALLLAHALFKFIWSNRLFGYCAVVMASTPNDPDDPRAAPRAAKAAEINQRAALNFNRGLRSIYFAVAGLAWLIGAVALLIAAVLVVASIMSREFGSNARAVLAEK